jgi:hypothetical protein
MQSVLQDGSLSKPSPEWPNRALRLENHLSRNVPRYPDYGR